MARFKIEELDMDYDDFEWGHGVTSGPGKKAMDKVFKRFMSEVVPAGVADLSCRLTEREGGKTAIEMSSVEGHFAEYIQCSVDLGSLVEEKLAEISKVPCGIEEIEWLEIHEESFRREADNILAVITAAKRRLKVED
jgi:hypothetical protein